MESEILKTLLEIRGMLYVITSGFIIIVFFKVVQIVSKIYLDVKESNRKGFNEKAKDLFDMDEYHKLIALSEEKLTEDPGFVHAYWWLARSHYYLGNDLESMKYFKELLNLQPSWEEKYIKPYLEKIKKRASIR